MMLDFLCVVISDTKETYQKYFQFFVSVLVITVLAQPLPSMWEESKKKRHSCMGVQPCHPLAACLIEVLRGRIVIGIVAASSTEEISEICSSIFIKSSITVLLLKLTDRRYVFREGVAYRITVTLLYRSFLSRRFSQYEAISTEIPLDKTGRTFGHTDRQTP